MHCIFLRYTLIQEYKKCISYYSESNSNCHLAVTPVYTEEHLFVFFLFTTLKLVTGYFINTWNQTELGSSWRYLSMESWCDSSPPTHWCRKCSRLAALDLWGFRWSPAIALEATVFEGASAIGSVAVSAIGMDGHQLWNRLHGHLRYMHQIRDRNLLRNMHAS